MKKRERKKDKPRTDRQKKSRKKKIAAGIAGMLLAAGVTVNEAFDPKELMQKAPADRNPIQEQAAAAQARQVIQAESYERISLADAVRGWFIRLPVAVKGTILLPLWAIGAIPVALASALSPLRWAVLTLALQVAILIALFCGVYKLVFPHRKVRELFRRKNLRWLFLGALTVTLANILLTRLWTDWPIWRAVILALVGLAVLCVLYKRICGAFKAPEPEVVKTRLVVDS